KLQVWTDAFLRIHFDLCEVERRKMEIRLNEPGLTVDRARKIYDEHGRALKNTLDTYLRHTRNGKDGLSLLPWHEMIVKELGIHNLTTELTPLQHDTDRPFQPVRE